MPQAHDLQAVLVQVRPATAVITNLQEQQAMAAHAKGKYYGREGVIHTTYDLWPGRPGLFYGSICKIEPIDVQTLFALCLANLFETRSQGGCQSPDACDDLVLIHGTIMALFKSFGFVELWTSIWYLQTKMDGARKHNRNMATPLKPNQVYRNLKLKLVYAAPN